jgi:hypothetical protein
MLANVWQVSMSPIHMKPDASADGESPSPQSALFGGSSSLRSEAAMHKLPSSSKIMTMEDTMVGALS